MSAIKEKLNYLRTIPSYLCVLSSAQRNLVEEDVDRWSAQINKTFTSLFTALNYFLTHYREFRNLLIHRMWNPARKPKDKANVLIVKFLWKPLDSLYLNTRYIGGGLFIQHGFSTIVSAKKLGKNCWINQQVTIGYKGEHAPIIGDNVMILCGAKVLGDIVMHDNSIAGANAVVIKDVPENAVVGGVPAKIIKFVENSKSCEQ